MITKHQSISKVPVYNLNFGAPDAQSEKTFVSERYFLNAFFLPEEVELQRFSDRRTFFVLGLKGAGKTALLQYIASKLPPSESETAFIIFKHDVDEEEKQKLQRISNTIVQSDNHDAAMAEDYENAWFWYLHQKIATQINQNKSEVFERDDAFNRYVQVIKGSSAPGEAGIASLANAAKDGFVKFSFDLKLLKVDGGINFEKVNSDKKIIALSWFVRAAMSLLGELKRRKKELVIFIDEINLSYGSRAQYTRDCILVRDLISAVYQMNTQLALAKIPIKLVCAIRTEVLSATALAGKEVNKYTNSCGMTLSWHRKVSDADQPLHRVIERKIKASEAEFFGRVISQDVWTAYFAPHVADIPIKEYILNQTWFTPRDLVVLLDLAKVARRDATIITDEMFRICRKDYAEKSWVEKIEALQANYNSHQIEAIRRVLQGVRNNFTYEAFAAEAASQGNASQQVKRLFSERDTLLVLEDLYRIGVIGNVIPDGYKKRRHRWMFRGDTDLDPKQPMAVHRALWAKFN